jgi:pyruvate formate lyase activating enzyme
MVIRGANPIFLADKSTKTRLVLSISRMTVHNGPGIRTLILFKGCPLRCLWCSTPESQNARPEIAVFSDKCIHCNECLAACPAGAIRLNESSLTSTAPPATAAARASPPATQRHCDCSGNR